MQDYYTFFVESVIHRLPNFGGGLFASVLQVQPVHYLCDLRDGRRVPALQTKDAPFLNKSEVAVKPKVFTEVFAQYKGHNFTHQQDEEGHYRSRSACSPNFVGQLNLKSEASSLHDLYNGSYHKELVSQSFSIGRSSPITMSVGCLLREITGSLYVGPP
jgi:hypothetical protein